MISPTPRTFLRLFLVIAGLWFIFTGIQDNDMIYLMLGFIAVILGGFGLWWQYRMATEEERN